VLINGKNISLRGLDIKDLDGDYIDWLNDADVNFYNSHARFAYSKDMAKEYIDSIYKNKNQLVCAIVENTNNKHIGNISLQSIDYISSNAELAILIGNNNHNKGIGYEASLLMIEHGFNQLNLHRIYCGTSSENIGMQKLALKLGMKQEGIRKEAMFKNGKYVDIVEYGILR